MSMRVHGLASTVAVPVTIWVALSAWRAIFRRCAPPRPRSSMETAAELPDDLPQVLGVLFDDPPCLLYPRGLGLGGVLARGRLVGLAHGLTVQDQPLEPLT